MTKRLLWVPRVWVLAIGLFLTTSFQATMLQTGTASAQTDPDYTLIVGSAIGTLGASLDITTTFDFPSGDVVSGISYGVCHDPAIVAINCSGGVPNDCVEGEIIIQGAALQATNGGAGAGFFAPAVATTPTPGYTVGVVVSLLGSDSLFPSENAEIAVATYECLAEGTTALTICETGSPAVLVSVGLTAGGGVDPVLANGQIEVLGAPPVSFSFSLPTPPVTINYDPETGIGSGEVALLLSEDDFGTPSFPNSTQGFSYGLRHDSTVFISSPGTPPVLDRGIRPSAALDALNGGSGPEFFGPNADAAGGPGHTVGVVYALLGGAFLQVPEPTPVIIITYQTVATQMIGDRDGHTVSLVWDGNLGDPVVVPGVAVANQNPQDPNPAVNFVDGSINLFPDTDLDFKRGNCNDDGSINIADAIFLFNWLFQDGEVPNCTVACDANGDTLVDSSDGIYIVNYRFLDGPEPPAPFAVCGELEGADCEVNNDCNP